MSTSARVEALKENIAMRRGASDARFIKAMEGFAQTISADAPVRASALPGHAHTDSVKALLAKLGIRQHEDMPASQPRFIMANADINTIALPLSGARQKSEAAQLTG